MDTEEQSSASAQPLDEPFAMDEHGITLRVNLQAYRLAAVKKSGYRLASRFTLEILSVAADAAYVRLHVRTKPSAAEGRELVRAFLEELLDQELREQVGEETAPLRALILAHAFSRTGLISES